MESFGTKAWLMLSLTLKHSPHSLRDLCASPGYSFFLLIHIKDFDLFLILLFVSSSFTENSGPMSLSELVFPHCFCSIWSALKVPCMNNAEFQKAFKDTVLHPVYAARCQHYLQVSAEHIRNANVLNELKQKNPEQLTLSGSFLLQYLYSPFQLHRTQTFTLCSSIISRHTNSFLSY